MVPPELLGELAKEGNAPSKRTLLDLKRMRDKRDISLSHLLVRPFIYGHGDRVIYDSQGSYNMRLKLARRENGILSMDPDVNEVFELSGFVRDYFRNTFGLNSLDDYGMDIIFNINYGVHYNNALWNGDEIILGNGDAHYFKSFTRSIDVIAHELTHGITQYHAHLEYYGQSGALNEHFSDVFGTIIRQKYLQQAPHEADWLIGKDVVGQHFQGKALRSISDPGSAHDNDPQIGHMDKYYTGNSGNQGVHINSGIPNKAFYLASMQLGIDVTGLVWFECLKKLWSTALFQDMVDMLLKVAEQLEIGGHIPSDSTAIIQESFEQVGLQRMVGLEVE